MDVLVEMTDNNLRKAVAILKKAGYRAKQPVDPMGLADNKNIKAFNFYKNETRYEQVDIVIDSPINYKKASKNALKIKVGKLVLNVISHEDLIKMKKNTGRDIDKKDIKNLKVLQKGTKCLAGKPKKKKD